MSAGESAQWTLLVLKDRPVAGRSSGARAPR